MDLITFQDFQKIEIVVGTIVKAEEKINLKKPSLYLTIDFGEFMGMKKSSAQLKINYSCKELINKQIIAVTNFPIKQIGNIFSEVLVLGLLDDKNEAILVSPTSKVKNGKRLC